MRQARMNEEYGIITSTTSKTGLSVRDVLTLVPIHVCTAVNMRNGVYLLEQSEIREEAARAGRLEITGDFSPMMTVP